MMDEVIKLGEFTKEENAKEEVKTIKGKTLVETEKF